MNQDQIHKIRDGVRRSLDDVGKMKAVGYLPIYTITDVLSKTVAGWAQALIERGLSVRILNESETCIDSGAMFVYDHSMVIKIMERHEKAIFKKGWKLDIDHVMTKISTEWFESDDPIMPFIRELYNDPL